MSPGRPDPDQELRRALDGPAVRTSARHDDAVLQAAREFAKEPVAGSNPRAVRRWSVPVALVAGLAAGVTCTVLLRPMFPTETLQPQPALVIPNTMRGSAAASLPVEQVPAEQWHRYIEELLMAGEMAEAERHLRRFNELHPGYVAPP